MKTNPGLSVTVPLVLALIGVAPVQAAVDADGAQALMKSNKCTKCHATGTSKTGPSLKSIAAKYKGKANGEEMVIKSITTGPKVKLDDGSVEEHTIIKTKDAAQLKNVAQWVLSH